MLVIFNVNKLRMLFFFCKTRHTQDVKLAAVVTVQTVMITTHRFDRVNPSVCNVTVDMTTLTHTHIHQHTRPAFLSPR